MAAQADLERLRAVKTLPSLIAYLRDALDWPLSQEAAEDMDFFDYNAEELGFDADTAVHIKDIKQLRPLDGRQPWGIFWVNFEKKRLPVVMLRRILGHLVLKKRAAARQANQRVWQLHDLLFISAYGEENDRAVSFAHFSQDPESPGDLPVLKVLGWDDGDTVLHMAGAYETLAEKLRWPAQPGDLGAWRKQWRAAFTLRHREVIETTAELVEELARLADSTRKRANSTLRRESERGPLRRLCAAFRATLIHDLTEDDFADVIAQTISYGLLIARFSRPAGIAVQNLVDMVPPTNPFLRELLPMFLTLAGRKGAFDFDELGIQDVVELLNRANADAVKADFGNRTRNEDPVIHFYEHFLAAYDRQKKIQRGVFYTPQPVVSYIVRSVHELLQKEFGLEDGLASTISWGEMLKKHPGLKLPRIRLPKKGSAEGEEVELPPDEPFVMILDIATGTATFLVEVIEVIFLQLKATWDKGGASKMPRIPAIAGSGTAARFPKFTDYWNAYVPHALLPRLYGYELMMAPYTIAHMKLALKFSELNARLGQADYLFPFEGRAHIYLTNALEPASGFETQKFEEFFPALAHEAAAVNDVKRRKRFTVVIGNPPYSLWSQNLNANLRAIVDPYRLVNGEPIKERGALQFEKILQDDYVKFFRLSQVQINNSGCGVLGLITNHSFTDNPTLRGMRSSLMGSFQRIFSLNLHGNSSKKERNPDGSADENVFDIKQGVAIFHGLQLPTTKAESRLYGDLWGTRESKYATLARSSLTSIPYHAFVPAAPFLLFKARDSGFAEEYESGWKIADMFEQGSMGIVTARDHVSLAFEEEPLLRTATDFRDSPLTNKAVCEKLDIPEKNGWDVAKARALIKQEKNLKTFIQEIDYRPFDTRKIFYHRSLVWGMSWPTMQHVLGKQNIGLSTTRSIETGEFQHICVSQRLIGHHFVSLKEVNYLFPLWLYPDEDTLSFRRDRAPNLKPEFLKAAALKLELRQSGADSLPAGLTPEDIFDYAYAVFHSPGYRSRYAEFLKIDFPRLPLTGNLELFRALAQLGGQLVSLHLLESPKLDEPSTEFIGGQNPKVEKVSWSMNTVWIDKAQTVGFKGVREDVWNFHIGGYQVCEKWLKDRKGRTLTKDDITHYHKIVIALSETIRLMAEIDAVIEKYGGWPEAFQPKSKV